MGIQSHGCCMAQAPPASLGVHCGRWGTEALSLHTLRWQEAQDTNCWQNSYTPINESLPLQERQVCVWVGGGSFSYLSFFLTPLRPCREHAVTQREGRQCHGGIAQMEKGAGVFRSGEEPCLPPLAELLLMLSYAFHTLPDTGT